MSAPPSYEPAGFLKAAVFPVTTFRNVTVYWKFVSPAQKSRYGRSAPKSSTFTKTSGFVSSENQKYPNASPFGVGVACPDHPDDGSDLSLIHI